MGFLNQLLGLRGGGGDDDGDTNGFTDFSSLDNCPYCGSPLAGYECLSCKVEFELVGGKMQEVALGTRRNSGSDESCESCQASLANADRYLPYEDGSNSNAYIKCSSCGHENLRYGFGEDDD